MSVADFRRSGCLVALVLILRAPAAWAEVEFTPEISIGVARTDNLTLVTGNEEAETVYELLPAFTLRQESQRLTTNAAYRLEAFYYDGRSDSDVYHRVNAEVSAALDPENFFIELGGNRGQAVRDPLAPIPQSNLPITVNRLERDEYYIGPTFQYGLGANATVRGDYRRSKIEYDDRLQFGGIGALASSFDEDTFGFSLDNYRRERGFSWALRYDEQTTDYGVLMPWEYRQATVELGAWIKQGRRVFVVGGKESAWDQPFDPSLEDTFWEMGYSHSAGDRLSAEFAVGERTFGNSGRVALDLTLRDGSMGLSYSEQPTTEGRNPFDRGGLLFPEAPEDFLTNPGSAERYISKRLQWSLDVEHRATDVSLTLFGESREDRTTFDGSPLSDEEQVGLYLTVTRRLGVNTDLVLDIQNVRRDFSLNIGDPTIESELTALSLAASYRLGARTRLSLTYAYADESTDQEAVGLEYTARLVSLLLTRTF